MEPISIEEVRARFADDQFATNNGAVIDEVGDHYARCSLQIEPRHLNAAGVVMGGVTFTLADFAFAVASNWQEGLGTVSLSSNIAYFSAATGGRLTAEAICVKPGRSVSCYRIEVTDESGRPVAAVTTVGFRKER